MEDSREGYTSPEATEPTTLSEWLDELMFYHGVSRKERQNALEAVDSLPADKELKDVLLSNEPHNYKLGFVGGRFVRWKRDGKVPAALMSVAEIVEKKAAELGIFE